MGSVISWGMMDPRGADMIMVSITSSKGRVIITIIHSVSIFGLPNWFCGHWD